MIESVLYYFVSFIGLVMRLLPVGAALAFGRGVGFLMYIFGNRRRKQIYVNLRIAFAATKSPQELRRICREVFIHYAEHFIQLLRLPLLTKDNYHQVVTMEGVEHIQEARKLGKGVMILAMHFGSWELANIGCAISDFPYKVLVKPQERHSRLDDLVNEYRSFSGTVVLERGNDTREILRSLKNNEVVSLIADQGGKEGELVSFFGRKASFSTGAIRIALKRGVPICFGAIFREGNGKHRMVFDPAKTLIPITNEEQDVISNLQMFVNRMEEYVRRYPTEYMWFYKIWKYSNETKIAVVSDGKIGHLRQSQTVAKVVQEQFAARHVNADIIEVTADFKSQMSLKLFALCALLQQVGLAPRRLSALKFFLMPESYKAISSIKADVIISCGSAAAGVNYYLGKENDAKSFAIQRPGLWDAKLFHLLILPQHDVKEKMKGNIAVTMGAPNLIHAAYLEQQKDKLLTRYAHLHKHYKPKIGLFIGGESKDIFISDRQIQVLINQLQGVLPEIGYELLVTTSRRTSKRVEQVVQKKLKGDENCALLIIANQQNFPEAVGGILGLSDIVIVSGDSISMISEAASSGKKIIVFSPEKRLQSSKVKNKHQRFIEELNARGYVISVNVEDVASMVMRLMRGKISTKQLNDTAVIRAAVERTI